MKHINTQNIEEWLFNHFEGTLNLEEQSQLMDFLDANPPFKEDLDAWMHSSVTEPEMEFPGMEDLLVEEPADVATAVASVGAASAGYMAIVRWGVGALAGAGLLFLGYQTTDDGEWTPDQEILVDNTNGAALPGQPGAQGTSQTDIENTQIAFHPGAHRVGDRVLADAGTLTPGDGFDSNGAAGTDPGAVQTSYTQYAMQGQPHGTQAGSNGSGANANGPAAGSDLAQPGQSTGNGQQPPVDFADPFHVNGTPPLNGPGSMLVGGEAGTTEEGDVVGTEMMNGTPAVEAGLVDDQAFRQDGYMVNRTANLGSDRWGEGSFNDPDWALKVLATPADPDGDGHRNVDHERAPSYSSLPYSGMWPFQVPHNGLGFNNEDRNPQLVVPNNNPLSLNPAMAGMGGDGVSRVALNGRSRWLGSSAASNGMTASFDTYIKGLGGLGVMASHETYGKGVYTATHVSVAYAPTFNLGQAKTGATLTVAIQGGYTQKRLNADLVAESETIEPRRGHLLELNNTGSELRGEYGYQDISLGTHLNAKRFYIGASVDHLTAPVEDIYDLDSEAEARLDRKFNAYIGTDFRRKRESEFVYSPALLFEHQGNLSELWVSNSFRYKGLMGGLSYGTSKAGRVMAGVGSDRLQVNYSFDVTRSELIEQHKGSHEIALRWLLK